MRRAVLSVWVDFNRDLEGLTDWLYCDVRGLVTVGLGNLVDPVVHALVLPFVVPDDRGRMAREDEIRRAWNTVHDRQDLRERGGGAYRDLTTIRLPRPAIDALVRRRLLANDSILASVFRRWYAWPADAVLAVSSMAWAMGPAAFAGFPKFCRAADADDWDGMIAECDINPQRGTIVTRNARNKACFANAARVQAEGLDPEVLLWRPTT